MQKSCQAVLLLKILLIFPLKLMDPVLLHVQSTQEYHMCVMNPVLKLLDMQHVLRITLGITHPLLTHVHLLVSNTLYFTISQYYWCFQNLKSTATLERAMCKNTEYYVRIMLILSGILL